MIDGVRARPVGLDFLNSVATPIDAPVDWLSDGAGLVAWLSQAKLVPAHALKPLTAQAAPGELDNVAGQARALREWFRGFVHKHMGRPLNPRAIRELRPLLMRDELFSRISPRHDTEGFHFELETTRRWRSPEFSTATDRRSAGAMRRATRTSPASGRARDAAAL